MRHESACGSRCASSTCNTLLSTRPTDSPSNPRRSCKPRLSFLFPSAILHLHCRPGLPPTAPTKTEEEELQLGPTSNTNMVADAVLSVVFGHARQSREQKDGPMRSFVFSSYNPDICTALNWKQPNCESLVH